VKVKDILSGEKLKPGMSSEPDLWYNCILHVVPLANRKSESIIVKSKAVVTPVFRASLRECVFNVVALAANKNEVMNNPPCLPETPVSRSSSAAVVLYDK
jgi:hypothetical protein